MKNVTFKACAILATLISSTVLAEVSKFVRPSARAELAKIP